jgi:hypothetical protein
VRRLVATSGALGTELRRDGYQFRPPEGFHMVRWEQYAGSRVGEEGRGRAPPGLCAGPE